MMWSQSILVNMLIRLAMAAISLPSVLAAVSIVEACKKKKEWNGWDLNS
jgi:hypothetical protein